jgi:hypothetical protein
MFRNQDLSLPPAVGAEAIDLSKIVMTDGAFAPAYCRCDAYLLAERVSDVFKGILGFLKSTKRLGL